MTLFRPTVAALDQYLRIIGIMDIMPTRCDLFFKPRLISFFTPNKEGIQCLKYIIGMANNYQNIVFKLKMIICLHHIVMTKNHVGEQILDQTINGLENKTTANLENGDVVKWMYALTGLYYNYIRKVCAHSQSYWLAKSQKPLVHKQPNSSIITKIYLFMNLLKSAFPMRDYILNFGRYFKAQYPLIIDVNKCIAQDMAIIYNSLVIMINHLVKIYKTKLSKEQKSQLLTIVDQTYLIHQDLYVLFYNRYYAYDVQAPKIEWLKLQPEQYQQLKDTAIEKKKKKKMDSSKASIDSLDLSQFQKTYFSQKQPMSKQFQFQELEI